MRKMWPAMVSAVVVLAFSSYAAAGENVLYSFNGSTDGGSPNGGVILDADGRIYGTSNGCYWGPYGAVYRLKDSSSGWIESNLYAFAGEADGGCPVNGVKFDSAGNLLGATGDGGNGAGDGVVYRMLKGKYNWTLDVVYQFTGGNDGGGPTRVISDSMGNLYGTAFNGGANNYGTVFKLTPQMNGGWKFTLIHAFDGAHGGTPYGGVLMDSAGNLYGTAGWGPHQDGVVFELSPQTGGPWKYTVLHAFAGGNDGSGPWRDLDMDASGNLYGTTENGGKNNDGVVFEISKTSGQWKESVLHAFNGSDGLNPTGVTLDPSGNLYGVAGGGFDQMGMVYKLTGSNGRWTETIVHKFSGSDGAYPENVTDISGRLYGTTRYGGASGLGVVFELIP